MRLKADLESEADELQAKLEALRMADYRDQQRAGCDRYIRQGDRAHSGGDIEQMYDFSRFPPDGREPSDADSVHLVRAREADLRERSTALELQVESQEEKLGAAAKALQKYRGQVQQLVAQLGLKDLDAQRLSTQVTQLRRVLVEKERRLQEALDAAERSVLGTAPDGPPQPAQEALSAGDEGQVLQLARIAEELTDALETAREGEESALVELEETTAKLEEEQAISKQRKYEIADAREARRAEVEDLRRQIAEQEQVLEAERALSKDFEQRAKRVEIEDFLQQRMASKGKAAKFQPHLEI